MKRKDFSHCGCSGCLQNAQLPTDYFVEQRLSIEGLSDSVIRAEMGIYKWLYHFIEDSWGSLTAAGETGIGQSSEDEITCGQVVSALCDTDVIACIDLIFLPSILMVLYS